MLAMKPQKFAISFTLGSLTFMGSFAILKGPKEHLQGMFQPDRIAFTTIYLCSMLLTLFCTFHFGGIRGYVLVLGSSMIQLVALVWYLISFLPGGAASLQYVFAAMSHMLRPVLMGCARAQAFCVAKCFGMLTSSSA
jgi:hypothetical protein